jgi:hypothetical protein
MILPLAAFTVVMLTGFDDEPKHAITSRGCAHAAQERTMR